MKTTFLAVAMAALLAFTGCNSGTSGGPGAKTKDKTTADKTTTADKDNRGRTNGDTGLTQGENTFKLTAPTLSTSLKQGESKEVTIGITRGKNFDQDVAVKFENMPKGVSVDPAAPTIKKGDKNVSVNVKAADDAALGDFTVKMIGHPQTGEDATHDLKLTVNKK